jgi:hypothetical protein
MTISLPLVLWPRHKMNYEQMKKDYQGLLRYHHLPNVCFLSFSHWRFFICRQKLSGSGANVGPNVRRDSRKRIENGVLMLDLSPHANNIPPMIVLVSLRNTKAKQIIDLLEQRLQNEGWSHVFGAQFHSSANHSAFIQHQNGTQKSQNSI